MRYRNEWKHQITPAQMLILRRRLSVVARPDAHGENGKYLVRSLYFDTAGDQALREKIDGVNQREKFRIRLYDHDQSVIHLEKKSKQNGLCLKEKTPLTAAQAALLAAGTPCPSDDPLLQQLYCKMTLKGLRPRTLVDYTREAFVYGPGNVRITLDYGIRTALRCTDLLNPHCPTVPIPEDPIILEVKWDEFLPDILRDALQLENVRVGAFSKYAACRKYD